MKRKLMHWSAWLFLGHSCFAAGLSSSGNTDGLLTWQLGDIEPGRTAREVVVFAYGPSYAQAKSRLEEAGGLFSSLPEPVPSVTPPSSRPIWILNESTDFALAGPGHFFWEGDRQSLSFSGGGQLSRFGYYIHYHDDGEKRAGTPITGERRPRNLSVLEPVHAVSTNQAVGWVETTDRQLRIRIRAILAAGPLAAVEFVVTNGGARRVRDVRLTAYANLEAAHDHENDYSVLDRRTAALLVVDPRNDLSLFMGGLRAPARGFSGVWPSEEQLQNAAGLPLDEWQSFGGIPASMKMALLANKPSGGIFEQYAPAPAAEPVEPETRDLTAAQAARVLEQDWIFQAENRPFDERARQEIAWARQMAARLAANASPPDLAEDLAALRRLEHRLADPSTSSSEEAGRDLYLAVRQVKRRIQFQSPAVDFSRILFIDQPYPQGREWQHQVRHRNGMMAVPGGRLLLLEGLNPAGHLRKLAPPVPGSFWRPDLSFDAERVLFCYKAHDEPSFHLYEIGLDGRGLRRITDGPYDDLDPIYLPDGRILFSTTRGNTFIRCMPYTYSYILARCDADGRNLYLISSASEPDWLPTLLHDGRVIYSRWDYIDKALWRIQSLWTVRQDGTGVETFWGNQSVWPDHLAEARPIPNSPRVIFTGLAHHDWFAGAIGILDPSQGNNFPHGLTKVTADLPWPESGNGPVDPRETPDYHTAGRFDAFKTPYPLSEEEFLVSARRDGKFRLYLMDVYGNRELIYEGAHHIWHALPAQPRVPPPAHLDRVAWPRTGPDRTTAEPGTFYSANVCQGVPDLPAGKVKYLRVLQMDHKTYSLWTRDARFSGPAISPLQDDGVKRILGTVPVQADGSVYFQAPPGVVLYFQLLDDQFRALQTMRSSAGLMPGEQRGCVGCHEQHSSVPPNRAGLALGRAPAQLDPPPWGAASISYPRLVQPVLDRYCGDCHQGQGEGRLKLDLTLRPAPGIFPEPYLTLIGPIGFGLIKQTQPPGIAGALMCENFDQNDPDSYRTLRPLRSLSSASPLIELCLSGEHYEVKLDSISLRQLIGWVDANCPYRGEEDVRAIPDPDFAGVAELPIRPRTQTAPHILRP